MMANKKGISGLTLIIIVAVILAGATYIYFKAPAMQFSPAVRCIPSTKLTQTQITYLNKKVNSTSTFCSTLTSTQTLCLAKSLDQKTSTTNITIKNICEWRK